MEEIASSSCQSYSGVRTPDSVIKLNQKNRFNISATSHTKLVDGEMDGAGDASFVMRAVEIPSPSLFPPEPTHHNTQEQQNSLNLIYRKSNQTINGWNYIKETIFWEAGSILWDSAP